MNDFAIVALPDDKTLKLLNDLKIFFNTNGYRGVVKNNTSDTHITLAHGSYTTEDDISRIKDVLIPVFNNIKQFKIIYEKVTNDIKGPNEKRDFKYSWIALSFDDKNIQTISKKVDDKLNELNISTTKEYVKKVHDLDPESLKRTIVGDHMNICNYCLLDFKDEAYNRTVKTVPKNFTIDKIAFRHGSGEHAWEIKLKP